MNTYVSIAAGLCPAAIELKDTRSFHRGTQAIILATILRNSAQARAKG
jgi:hypothetical protein